MTKNSGKSSVITLLLFISISLLPSSLSQHDNTTNCTNASNASAEYAQCLDDIPIYDSCPDPSLCEASGGDNVGLAFGLTIGAGLATTLGALLPFVPLIKRSNTTFLAIGLALAAGVMLYVSFTEILKKARDNFCCNTPSHYELAATGCFFGGILLTVLLDLLVGLLQRIDCGCGCTSRCSRQQREVQDLDGKDETRQTKLKEKSLSLTRNTKPRINGVVNGLHREFDFMHYHDHSEEGHTPMMSSSPSDSEITSNSTPTADHLEEEEEPGAQVAMVTHHHNGSETESGADPVQNSSSQRALLCNDTDSASNSNGSVPFNRMGSVSISDTESRRYAAVTPDVVSTTLSENTNNYANASVNELFSNSSLLRMNAVIPPETVSENASAASAVGAGGEEGGVVMADVQSHMSVTVEEVGGGMNGGDGEACDGGKKTTLPSKLLRRISYSEMVDQKHDDIQPMGPEEFKEVAMVIGKDARKLHRMGILTGLAIGIHNFPEGLATFVAALSSPSLGIALAIAIALHNIPEGVCVSMPVYYATGKKWKGFLWAFLSGISEPFGALLGWLVFKDIFGPLVYGCLFGLIAGMMVFISLKELIPTAHKFDRRGILVAVFLVVGMVVMAASLLLFLY